MHRATELLHPACARVLDAIVARNEPTINQVSPAKAREDYIVRAAAAQMPGPASVAVTNLCISGPGGDLPLRIYRPVQQELEGLPALVFFHGGGWLLGNLDTHDNLCRELSAQSSSAIVAVDYRLAPEHPYPAAVQDAWCALSWVRQQGPEHGIDPRRLAVGGDSAGANLAAVLAIMARDAGLSDPLAFQLLIYPTLAVRTDSSSYQEFGEGFFLTRRLMDYFIDQYVPHRGDRGKWEVAPLLCDSHAALPPALVVTAGFDPLRDDGARYAQKLSASGGVATLINFERQIHGFMNMSRLIDEASVATRQCALALRDAMSAPPVHRSNRIQIPSADTVQARAAVTQVDLRYSGWPG